MISPIPMQSYDAERIAGWLDVIGVMSLREDPLTETVTSIQKSYGGSHFLQEEENINQKLYEKLKDGVALCKLLNIIKPDSINKITLIEHDFAAIDNINRFLAGCEIAFGLDKKDLFEVNDLYKNENQGKVSLNFDE